MNSTVKVSQRTRLVAALIVALTLTSQCTVAQTDSTNDSTWRCSADGLEYRIEEANGFLRINGIRAGRIQASLPMKAKKSGQMTIMGQWQAGMNRGFIEITGRSQDRISAFLLVPQNGAAPGACLTRTLAVLTAMSAAPGQLPGCGRLDVTWERQDMNSSDAFNSEVASEAQERAPQEQISSATQQVPQANSGLVGTWASQDASAVHYTRIEITLRADGTYEKTLQARTPGWGGGGMGAGGLGGTHQGRWTAVGTVVHLSGDGNWPASTHDLSSFRRVR